MPAPPAPKPPAAAVVTGGGNGLGREIARGLGRRGYAVGVTDVDLAAAEAVAAELGGDAWAAQLDVVDPEACRVVARDAAERGRATGGGGGAGLAVWVNNAGILRTGPSWEEGDASRKALFDVNVHGTVNGTLAALEQMRPAVRGTIVNVVSLGGLVPAVSETLYSATKHAALAFSVGTQADLQQAGLGAIRVCALCPDGMWTPMLFDLASDPSAAPSWSGVMLMPEEVAQAALELLDRPRPVRPIPRWRGAQLRLVAAFPRVYLASLPLALADARRRQRAFAREHAS